MIPTPSAPSSDLPLLQSPITVSVNLHALARNFQQIRQWIAPPTKILAIIKADAYGHGAGPVAHTLESLGIFGFGVASVLEGMALREYHIHCPIVVMGPLLPEHLREIIHHQLTPVISRFEILQQLIDVLPPGKPQFPIHLKIDTGLHRLGFETDRALSALTTLSRSTSPVVIQGFLTHFADADNHDPSLTNQQIQQFLAFVDQAKQMGIHPPILHIANSAGILFHPTAHLGMVRPGLMLYGYAPRQEGCAQSVQLQPVMKATTYVAHLRSLQPGEIVGYNATLSHTEAFTRRRPAHWLYARISPSPHGGRACPDPRGTSSHHWKNLHGYDDGGCHRYAQSQNRGRGRVTRKTGNTRDYGRRSCRLVEYHSL